MTTGQTLSEEFERFERICLMGKSPQEIKAVQGIYLAGASAATHLFLAIIRSDYSVVRKKFLMERMMAELEAFKKSVKPKSKDR